MNATRVFKPFSEVIIPVFDDYPLHGALSFARRLNNSRVVLLGVAVVPINQPISGGNLIARELRKHLILLNRNYRLNATINISVAHYSWEAVNTFVRTRKSNLVLLTWPEDVPSQQKPIFDLLRNVNANMVLVHGEIASDLPDIAVPLRGGPNAQLALRLGLALSHRQITALHLRGPESTESSIDAPFRGISRILPNLPEINYIRKTSLEPIEDILNLARESDLIIIGISDPALMQQEGFGRVADRLINESTHPVIIVKSQIRAPREYTGREGELSGAQAISILVDKWFAENTFHASEFDDIASLVRLKEVQNLTISLALPALNEEDTVGKVITTIKKALIEKYPLIDEIVLMDSNSTDRTRQIAQDLGIPVHIHQETLPQYEAREGKGDALWKSLFVTRGDILIWIDSDIVNIHPRFVYGVLGPLLVNPNVQFVKGFYQRPLQTGRRVQSTGGGRVTELTARPLINLFYPELSGVIQPLSGEYGGRRKALEQLTFFTGYGVETGLLIDVFEKFGLGAIAQVDLLERIHHNQTLTALSKMSFAIIQTVLKKLEERIHSPLFEDVNRSMKMVQYQHGSYFLDVKEIIERERPPMIGLPEYRDIFYPQKPG
jgi:hypothetical protein